MKATARVFDVAKRATIDYRTAPPAPLWTVYASGDDLRVQWVTDAPPAKESTVTVTIAVSKSTHVDGAA